MGICLQNVGVHFVDSAQALDGDTKPKFMPLDLENYLMDANSTIPEWLRLMSFSQVETVSPKISKLLNLKNIQICLLRA